MARSWWVPSCRARFGTTGEAHESPGIRRGEESPAARACCRSEPGLLVPGGVGAEPEARPGDRRVLLEPVDRGVPRKGRLAERDREPLRAPPDETDAGRSRRLFDH